MTKEDVRTIVNERLDELNIKSLPDRVNKLEVSLIDRINTVEDNLNQRINNLDVKISKLEGMIKVMLGFIMIIAATAVSLFIKYILP